MYYSFEGYKIQSSLANIRVQRKNSDLIRI